jgi:hypothetical protein
MAAKIGNGFLVACLLALSICFAFVNSDAQAGNDFIYTELRVDLPIVYSARDYKVLIGSMNGLPSGPYTSAWLGLELATNPGLFGKQFSQVGIMTNNQGVYWFVYAEPGVQCLRGNYGWWDSNAGKYLGCYGDYNDLVSPNQYFPVELVTYQEGYWIARITDQNGLPHDLAKIWTDSVYTHRANVNMEEGYSQSQDPFLLAQFVFWHPQYFDYSYQTFLDWPTSMDGHINILGATDLACLGNFCPGHYGAIVNLGNDERNWYAGTSGNVCQWTMFPNYHIRVPIVSKN